jgi:hypothetical protein
MGGLQRTGMAMKNRFVAKLQYQTPYPGKLGEVTKQPQALITGW